LAVQLRQSGACAALDQTEFTHASINQLFQNKAAIENRFR